MQVSCREKLTDANECWRHKLSNLRSCVSVNLLELVVCSALRAWCGTDQRDGVWSLWMLLHLCRTGWFIHRAVSRFCYCCYATTGRIPNLRSQFRLQVLEGVDKYVPADGRPRLFCPLPLVAKMVRLFLGCVIAVPGWQVQRPDNVQHRP